MDNKLEPCPFCGKAPEESERADNNTCTGRAYFVSCMCGGYSANAHQFGETKEEVVSKWNRRAYAEQLERERDELQHDKQQLETYQLELLERAQVLERERDELKQRLSTQPVDAVVDEADLECHIPPFGWRCTRGAGHEGSCAAVECPDDVEAVKRGMERLAAQPTKPAEVGDTANLKCGTTRAERDAKRAALAAQTPAQGDK